MGGFLLKFSNFSFLLLVDLRSRRQVCVGA